MRQVPRFYFDTRIKLAEYEGYEIWGREANRSNAILVKDGYYIGDCRDWYRTHKGDIKAWVAKANKRMQKRLVTICEQISGLENERDVIRSITGEGS